MDETVYIKTMCDFKACALEGTDHCQKCREKELDKDNPDTYINHKGRVFLLSPDLNKE